MMNPSLHRSSNYDFALEYAHGADIACLSLAFISKLRHIIPSFRSSVLFRNATQIVLLVPRSGEITISHFQPTHIYMYIDKTVFYNASLRARKLMDVSGTYIYIAPTSHLILSRHERYITSPETEFI